ncbi:porin family protein [Marinobacter hydrocarbonoclasticus]|nr:porin family protein [Marinobacter nauticus]
MKLALISLPLLTLAVAPALARPQGAPAPWELDLYGVQMADTDLERDGGMGDASFGAELAYSTRLGPKWMLGSSVSLNRRTFDFDAPTLFDGTLGRFDYRDRIGFGFNGIYLHSREWQVIVAPRFQWAAADGADLSDGFSYGVLAGGMYRVSEGLQLGLGLSYLNDVKETKSFPILLVKWQITDKLKLDNPFDPGFAGRAGLELSYRWNPHFELGVGGAYRSDRFATENGAVEFEEPVFFGRLSYFPSDRWDVSAAFGYRAEGEMQWEPDGAPNPKQELDGRVGFGINMSWKF